MLQGEAGEAYWGKREAEAGGLMSGIFFFLRRVKLGRQLVHYSVSRRLHQRHQARQRLRLSPMLTYLPLASLLFTLPPSSSPCLPPAHPASLLLTLPPSSCSPLPRLCLASHLAKPRGHLIPSPQCCLYAIPVL